MLFVNLQPLSAKFSPSRWRNTYILVRSNAVLTGGGMRPAAATLRSEIRKLKVAHALGCNTAKRQKWKTIKNQNLGQLSLFVSYFWSDMTEKGFFYHTVEAVALPLVILYRVLHLQSNAFPLE